MKIGDNEALRERLAGEYVLGTLRGGARRRLERWLTEDAALRRAVAEWQDRLAPLAQLPPAQAPGPQVWLGIARQLRLAEPAPGQVPAPTWQFWRNPSLAFWRGLGMASSAVAALLVVTLALVLNGRAPQAPVINYLATLTDEQARTALLLTADSGHRVLTVRVLAAAPVAADKSLQLWAVPVKGAPRSLGVLVGKDNRLALPANAVGGDVALLAVSLEPKGGSPDPRGPTGPILYKGNWLRGL